MYVYHYFGNKYTDNVETGIVYALLCVHCDWLFDPTVSALYPVSVCVCWDYLAMFHIHVCVEIT